MAKDITRKPTDTQDVTSRSSNNDIQNFIKAAKVHGDGSSGRLIFALDATMSRQPTWDRALSIQASMFETAGSLSGLAVQLVYFRGYGECRASRWVRDAKSLAKVMTGIDCRGGATQIGKVLSHTKRENAKKRVAALVFVGDAMEENVDQLCNRAGELGIKGIKAFMFQEGHDPTAEAAFREIARLTSGAYMRLSGNSANELRDLLRAVAAYASGGRNALLEQNGKSATALLEQLKP